MTRRKPTQTWGKRADSTQTVTPARIIVFLVNVITESHCTTWSAVLTFLRTGSTLRLLCGISKLSASPHLRFGAIMKSNKGHLNTSTAIPCQSDLIMEAATKWRRGRSIHSYSVETQDKGMIHILGTTKPRRDFMPLLRTVCNVKLTKC